MKTNDWNNDEGLNQSPIALDQETIDAISGGANATGSNGSVSIKSLKEFLAKLKSRPIFHFEPWF